MIATKYHNPTIQPVNHITQNTIIAVVSKVRLSLLEFLADS